MSIFRGSRYSTVKNFTDVKIKKTLKTKYLMHNRRVFSRNDVKENFVLHTVGIGEIIDKIAWTYYRDSTLWWIIADVNELDYAFDLYPGQILTIPNKDVLRGIIS